MNEQWLYSLLSINALSHCFSSLSSYIAIVSLSIKFNRHLKMFFINRVFLQYYDLYTRVKDPWLVSSVQRIQVNAINISVSKLKNMISIPYDNG